MKTIRQGFRQVLDCKQKSTINNFVCYVANTDHGSNEVTEGNKVSKLLIKPELFADFDS